MKRCAASEAAACGDELSVATIPAIMPEHGPRKAAKSPEKIIDDAVKR